MMTKKTYKNISFQVVELKRPQDIILTSLDAYGMNTGLLGDEVEDAW